MMAKGNRLRIATVFATHTHCQAQLGAAPISVRNLDKVADALFVEHLKRVVLENALFQVGGQKARRVIPAETVRQLGEIVGANTEKVGMLRNIGRHAAPLAALRSWCQP